MPCLLLTQMQEFTAWAISIGVVLVAGISGVFKWMWGKIRGYIEACETDRKDLRVVINGMQQESGEMKETLANFQGCTTDPCGALESIKRRREFKETYQLRQVKKPSP